MNTLCFFFELTVFSPENKQKSNLANAFNKYIEHIRHMYIFEQKQSAQTVTDFLSLTLWPVVSIEVEMSC